MIGYKEKIKELVYIILFIILSLLVVFIVALLSETGHIYVTIKSAICSVFGEIQALAKATFFAPKTKKLHSCSPFGFNLVLV
jgi:hypothetical protein